MNKKLIINAYLVAVAIIFGVSNNAHAVTILQDGGIDSMIVANNDPIGQSFIAVDTQLDSIAFRLFELDPAASIAPTLTMSLFDGTFSGGTVIQTVSQKFNTSTLQNEANAQFLDFDFSGVSLNVGSIYTAVLTINKWPNSNVGLIYNANGNSYLDGETFFRNSQWYPECNDADGCDVDFRVSAVPLPAAVWLLGSGLIGLFGVARRKNKLLLS